MLSHSHTQVLNSTYTVDETLLIEELPPSGNEGSTKVLVEYTQALEVLAGEPTNADTLSAE